MLSRERVATVIRHGQPDRMPIYGWVSANMSEPITARFGSVAAFEDQYEFDLAHLFGGPGAWDGAPLEAWRREGVEITPRRFLEVPLTDPNVSSAYDGLRQQIQHHQTARGRFVYVQTPGIFECLNGAFGIENHLLYLGLYEDDLHEVYRRQAEWNRQFADNCMDLGVDMVHVSDDWGAERGLLFSPRQWWRLIHPYHRLVTQRVKERGFFVSVHSDGNVNAVIDGILDLGYDVMHPWQESAGMSLEVHHRQYRDRLTVMGGLDIQTTIGFGKLDRLKHEIERVMRLYADGGLIFCTTHFVQNHCTIEELVYAYDLVYDLARRC